MKPFLLQQTLSFIMHHNCFKNIHIYLALHFNIFVLGISLTYFCIFYEKK